MAAIEQKDIDELLNTINSGNNLDETPENNEVIDEEKVFRIQKNPILKINIPYKSPVIKSENIIFDPESDINSSEEKTIVWSLNNYMKHISENNIKQT